MSGQVTFFGRLGRMFRRSESGNGNSNSSSSSDPSVVVETRPALLRTWGRNNAAIAQLQEGFGLLTELMSTIRDNMEAQGRRQDELIAQVSALPKVLETLPEATRMQGETVKAIHQQLISQAEQQQILGEILHKLVESGSDQKDLIDGLRVRVETLNEQDKAMADSLHTVGAALESVNRNSAASTQVLCNIRDNLASRDTDLEKVLQRQATRFTAMMAMAVVLSVVAVVAVVVMGYLMIHAGHR